MEKKNIGMCGLDCNSCAAFIAFKNNNEKLRKKTAKEWTKIYKSIDYNRPPLKPEDINCQGCLSSGGVHFKYCLKCKIRKCGLKKRITNCSQCQKFKCDKLIKLLKHLH